MSEPRFTTLTPETMTADQKRVADAIQSGPRGTGLRGPFNALLRSPELCDLVQRVGAFVRFGELDPAAAERDGDHHGRSQVDGPVRVLRASPAGPRSGIESGHRRCHRGQPAPSPAWPRTRRLCTTSSRELLATGSVSDAAFPARQGRLRRARRRRSRRCGRLLQPGVHDPERRAGAPARRSHAAAQVRRTAHDGHRGAWLWSEPVARAGRLPQIDPK